MKGKGGKQFRALLTMKEHRRGMDTRLFSNSLPPTTSLLEEKLIFSVAVPALRFPSRRRILVSEADAIGWSVAGSD